MLPDRVSNPGPLTYESDALPIALRGPAQALYTCFGIYDDMHVAFDEDKFIFDRIMAY